MSTNPFPVQPPLTAKIPPHDDPPAYSGRSRRREPRLPPSFNNLLTTTERRALRALRNPIQVTEGSDEEETPRPQTRYFTPPTSPEPRESRWECNDPSHHHPNPEPTPTRTFAEQGVQTPVLFTVFDPPTPPTPAPAQPSSSRRPEYAPLFRQPAENRPPSGHVFTRSETIAPVTFNNTTVYFYNGHSQDPIGRTSVTSTRLYFDRQYGYLYEIHVRRRIDGHPHLLIGPSGQVLPEGIL